MYIVAVFSLRQEADETAFLTWVKEKQKPVFERKLAKCSHFEVRKIVDNDNWAAASGMLQTFYWDGIADEWRETLAFFSSGKDEELQEMADEWRSFCVEETTKIVYAKG
jgi:hypothetical protein